MKIVSVSDIHIRIASRHDEYEKVFKRLIEDIKQIKPDYIFNLGDLFHNKLTLSPESIILTRWLWSELTQVCPVISIIGNHDINLTNLDRPNSVEAVLEGIENNIIFVKNGYHVIKDGFGVGVFSILESKETWPFVIDDKHKDNINIALYHGAVNSSHDDSGYMIDHSINSKQYFSNYDFVMCGDIHKTEQLDSDGRIWMTGNLIQQNFGEALDKGYLIWDIKSKDDWIVTKVNIQNDHNFITVILEDDNYTKSIKKISEELRLSGVTNKSNVRIKIASDNVSDPTFKDNIKTYIINEFGLTPIIVDTYNIKSNDFVISTNQQNRSINFSDNNIQSQLIQNYVNETPLRKKLNVDDLIRINEELNHELGSTKEKNIQTIWEPIKLELSNIFCFGEDICLDFEKNLKGLVGLFGKNASGKSSLFNALTFAIFGKAIKKVNINDILRHNAKNGFTRIIIRKGDVVYRIERNIISTKNQKHIKNNVTFDQYNNETNEWLSLNEETIPDTNKRISETFGSFDDFLMTSMSTQEDYNLFINSGNSNRKDVIMKNLGLGIFRELHELSNQKIKSINEIIDHIDDTDLLVIKLQNLKQNIINIENNKNEYNKIIKEQKKISKDLNDDIEKLSLQISHVGDQIIDFNKLSSLRDKNSSDLEKIDEYIQFNIDRGKAVKKTIEMEEDEANNQLIQISKNITKTTSDIAVVKNNINRLQEKNLQLNNIDCDRSDCMLLRLYKEDINSLTEQKEQLEKYIQTLSELNETKKYLQDQIEGNQNIISLKKKIIDLSKDKKLIEQKNEIIQQQLNDYENNKIIIEKNNELNIIIKELKSKKEDSDIIFNKTTAQKEVDRRLIMEYQERINEINNTLEKINNMKKKLEILLNYKDIMNPNALPNVLLNSYVNIFENEVNRILGSSTDLRVKVDLICRKDAKNTELEIKYMNSSRNPDWMPIELASGAEKMLLSLSIRVSLTNITTIQKSNILIIDEGFGVLAAEWLYMLKNLFESFKDSFHSIIMVSHLDSIQDLPNIILTVSKENNISYIN